MNLQDMIRQMYDKRNEVLHEHEALFIEKMYKKIVYARREAEGHEAATIKKLYRIFMGRTINH